MNSVVPGWKIGIPCIPPVKGVRFTVPAAVTPGMLRTASSIACLFSAIESSACSTWLRSISTSIAPCGWKPSGTCSARTMPRTATSEAVTSSVQMAICAPNNRSRRANRRRCMASTGPFFIICNGLLRHVCRAGTIPNNSALPSVNARPARYTRASRVTARWPTNGGDRFNTPSSRSALPSPAAPPISDTITASVSSCLTSRHRLDPRATRSASSRLRSAARAANRRRQVRARRRQHQQRQHGHALKESANDVAFVPDESWMDQPQRLSVVGLRILLRQLGRNRIQIFRRLLRRHARLKPANHCNSLWMSGYAGNPTPPPAPRSPWESSSPATQTAPCRGTAPAPRQPR